MRQGSIRRFFAPEEAAGLGEAAHAEILTDRFFLTWTLKEAVHQGPGHGAFPSARLLRLSPDGGTPRPDHLFGLHAAGGETLHWAAIAPRPHLCAALERQMRSGKRVHLRCYRATTVGGSGAARLHGGRPFGGRRLRGVPPGPVLIPPGNAYVAARNT